MTTKAGFGSLVLRIPVGVILAAHGAQKLFGWFDGPGLEGVAGWFASIGLNPGLLMATLAGSAEFFGGILLILGLLTRPAAVFAAFTMLIAILIGHIGQGEGFFQYEFGLALLAATVCLAIQGGGSYSVDERVSSS